MINYPNADDYKPQLAQLHKLGYTVLFSNTTSAVGMCLAKALKPDCPDVDAVGYVGIHATAAQAVEMAIRGLERQILPEEADLTKYIKAKLESDYANNPSVLGARLMELGLSAKPLSREVFGLG